MKKLFFIAAIASVALASCVKNEVAPTAMQQDEITFAAPVVGPQTKASLSGTTYPTTHGDFKVFAWYHEGDYVQANASSYATYMNNVTVTYNSTIDDSTAGSGAWHASSTYYWPKNENAKLSFDAYYPATGLTASATAAAGIVITDYTVDTDLSKHIDILVSDRAWNKENSTSGSNTTYDGVDIKFNHVLSSINFTVATATDYVANTIKVKSITVKGDSKGTFKQNVTGAGTQVPFWEGLSNNQTYTVISNADAASSTLVTSTATSIGTEAILLPQNFGTGQTSITVEYYITNGTETPLPQTETFNLTDTGYSATEGGSAVAVTSWEQGHKYIYNIVFTLNEVYFAPEVVDWVPVETTGYPAI